MITMSKSDKAKLTSVYISKYKNGRESYKLVLSFDLPEEHEEIYERLKTLFYEYNDEHGIKPRKYRLFDKVKSEFVLYVENISWNDMSQAFECRSVGDIMINLAYDNNFIKTFSKMFLEDVEYMDEQLYNNCMILFRKRHLATW